jgi:outer membrane protein assembly factor BamB
MFRRPIAVAFCLLALAACDIPSWMGGDPEPIKRTPGERIDVVLNQPRLKPDDAVKDVPIEVPEQTNLAEWHNHNEAMLTPHIGLTGITKDQSASIGDSNPFSQAVVSPPVVAQGFVFAMDAAGVISAHDEADISNVHWTNSTGLPKHVYDVLGGGLAFDSGTLYATTGYGGLRAIDATSGKTKWNINVGAPVRGAPAIGEGMVVVLTADNQTLAFEAATGAPRWEHRGIRETAGYFSTTAPVISDGIVIAAYSSGEIFAIRVESGSVLWNDTLSSTNKTDAAAIFSGIDADPIVQDGVVVVTTASGEMQASALLNGRPLWQQRVGAHTTPWSAGNAMFVLSDTHDLAAILKRDGGIRWATSLATHDERDKNKDTTPALYGPILAGNAVLVLDRDGNLSTFKPQDGTRLSSFELAGGVASMPIIANGALYYVSMDAKLHKYY